MGRRERRRDGKPPKQLNPLKSVNGQCLDSLVPSWVEDSFTDISKPFIVDIGCGEGEWLVAAASACSEYNFLGVEIRYEAILVACDNFGSDDILINRKMKDRNPSGNADYRTSRKENFRNLGIIHANLLCGDLHSIMRALRLRNCVIRVAAVQFPDPHWKGKHRKRRIITLSLLQTMSAYLSCGGMFYLQSDVAELIKDTKCLVRQAEGDISVLNEYLKSPPSNLDIPVFSEISGNLILQFPDNDVVVEQTEITSPGVLWSVIEAQTCFTSNPSGVKCGFGELERYLPSSLWKFETERATYVRRQKRKIYHLLCISSAQAFIKGCCLKQVLGISPSVQLSSDEVNDREV